MAVNTITSGGTCPSHRISIPGMATESAVVLLPSSMCSAW